MRTNHCFFCDACVAKQDHHSIWMNCCIGEERASRERVGAGGGEFGAGMVFDYSGLGCQYELIDPKEIYCLA